MNDEKQLHWLVRPSTIRKLWIGFSVLLLVLVLAQTVIYVKGYFGFDAMFGFAAIYGFTSCLVMVLLAKLLGLVLKRPQDYYEDSIKHDLSTSSSDKMKGDNHGL
jgi:sterol desaturase/sphingolipid hydroxylase (fatty acid hydroxylase superfamily)